MAPRQPLTRTYTPAGAVERWLELPSNSADQVAEPTESLNVALKRPLEFVFALTIQYQVLLPFWRKMM